ncbi:maleylpyruvate isomerase family mycothiol-dependent enzyme [Streptomyces odontomachi]|uniref:maleylpyruvate isomerase family mycothiol-dependent enzyme n=1 Tax=Streptomyces odontomachi TaxID=2944940 RepID=UPI00210CB92E|nr:maleylpyruvate isomerase family mycothiol-dependent enzyme [Streptomyces sp. ODS25]
MSDHVRDLSSVRTATDRLLSAAAELDDAALAGPSLLPGWTRGHVLAHIARNADALVNVLEGRPMYLSDTARDADIGRDAPRAPAVQLADVRDTAARFQEAAAALPDWSRIVLLRNGVTDAAANLPFRRLIEVELHHVDLGAGYPLEALPGDFTERAIGYLARRFEAHPDVPPTALADDSGHTWRTGGTAGDHVTVDGTAADLLGWLSGRRDGGALTVSGGALPKLPAL